MGNGRTDAAAPAKGGPKGSKETTREPGLLYSRAPERAETRENEGLKFVRLPWSKRDRVAISRVVLSERHENGGRITIAAPSIPETEAGREISSRAAAASRTSALRELLVYIEPRGCSSPFYLFLFPTHRLSASLWFSLYPSFSLFYEMMSPVLLVSTYGT